MNIHATPEQLDTLIVSLGDYGLSGRTVNTLERGGYIRIGDLASVDPGVASRLCYHSSRPRRGSTDR